MTKLLRKFKSYLARRKIDATDEDAAAALQALGVRVAVPAPPPANPAEAWLAQAVRRAWRPRKGKQKCGGVGGKPGPCPENETPTGKSPGIPNRDAMEAALAARKEKWKQEHDVRNFERDLETPMSDPPPGYATTDKGDSVHVPTIVSETQKLTAEKLRLNKMANDDTVLPGDRKKAAAELKRLGGLNADEQKMADLCKSMADAEIESVVKGWVAKCGGPGSGKPGPCPEGGGDQSKYNKPDKGKPKEIEAKSPIQLKQTLAITMGGWEKKVEMPDGKTIEYGKSKGVTSSSFSGLYVVDQDGKKFQYSTKGAMGFEKATNKMTKKLNALGIAEVKIPTVDELAALKD